MIKHHTHFSQATSRHQTEELLLEIELYITIDTSSVTDDHGSEFLACAKRCKYIIACHLPGLYSDRQHEVVSMVHISAIEGGLV